MVAQFLLSSEYIFSSTVITELCLAFMNRNSQNLKVFLFVALKFKNKNGQQVTDNGPLLSNQPLWIF